MLELISEYCENYWKVKKQNQGMFEQNIHDFKISFSTYIWTSKKGEKWKKMC